MFVLGIDLDGLSVGFFGVWISFQQFVKEDSETHPRQFELGIDFDGLSVGLFGVIIALQPIM